jgi:TRAP-type uncharacterized transport system substrate-binding protein
MASGRKISITKLKGMFTELFGVSRAVAFGAIFLFSLVMILAVYLFFHLAPPHTLTITSGPEGTVFQINAEKYRKILARNGVKLKILPSQGSLENLKRLSDPSFHVDLGFVQGGLANGLNIEKLVSLGSISYEPLLVFYRGAAPLDLLSQLTGKRITIGHEGSGTRTLALTLLAANGIEPGGATVLLDLEGEAAATALLERHLDALFLMGDAASPQTMRKLLQTQEIQIFDFTQADAYTRRIVYLNKLDLPKGSVDFGKNIPSHDVYLLSPTVELIARADLHPALSDLLIEAAGEIHGSAGLFKRQGEFPTPLEHEFRISDDASRYYKSGKGFLYRYLPFQLASLVNRIIVVLVPVVLVLLPGLRIIPMLYQWRVKLRIYRSYRALLTLEKEMFSHTSSQKREELLKRLDHIEGEVNKMKVPASSADQFYALRGHIDFVHDRLIKKMNLH